MKSVECSEIEATLQKAMVGESSASDNDASDFEKRSPSLRLPLSTGAKQDEASSGEKEGTVRAGAASSGGVAALHKRRARLCAGLQRDLQRSMVGMGLFKRSAAGANLQLLEDQLFVLGTGQGLANVFVVAQPQKELGLFPEVQEFFVAKSLQLIFE
jgi:hypothetical protein